MKTRIIKMKRANRSAQTVVIRLNEKEYGSNDETKLALVRRLLMDQVEKPRVPHVLVDFSAVECFGARFIATLVSTRKELEKRQRRLALCGLSPFCRELIEVVQLDRLFDIYSTLQIAVEEFEGNGPCESEETQPTRENDLNLSGLLPCQPERWQASCLQPALAC